MDSERKSISVLIGVVRGLIKAVALFAIALIFYALLIIILYANNTLHTHRASAQASPCPAMCNVVRVCRQCAAIIGDSVPQVKGCGGGDVPLWVSGGACPGGVRICYAVRNSDGSGMLAFTNNCSAGNPPGLGLGLGDGSGIGRGGDGGSGGSPGGGGSPGRDGEGGAGGETTTSPGDDDDDGDDGDGDTPQPDGAAVGLTISVNSSVPDIPPISLTTPRVDNVSVGIGAFDISVRLSAAAIPGTEVERNIVVSTSSFNNTTTITTQKPLATFASQIEGAVDGALGLLSVGANLTAALDSIATTITAGVVDVAAGLLSGQISLLRNDITSSVAISLLARFQNRPASRISIFTNTLFSKIGGVGETTQYRFFPPLLFRLPFGCGYNNKAHNIVQTGFFEARCIGQPGRRGSGSGYTEFIIHFSSILTEAIVQLIRFFSIVGAYIAVARILLVGY